MTTGVMTNYLENAFISHTLRNTTYTSPGTSVYVGLFTAAPSDTGGGTEVSGGSYARQQVTAWNAPSNGATYNTNAITFPQASASWGTVTWVGVFDTITTGNLLFYGQLTTGRLVDINYVFSIAAGDLDITLGGAFSYYLANALLSHTLRNTAYTTPGTVVYAALYTAAPTAAGGGTEVSTAGTAYARNQITAWDAPSTGQTQNTSLEAWSAATATWNTVTSVGILDNATAGAGNLLLFGNLDANKTVASGDTFQFAAGALDISLD